jgi:hypothetical protein
MRLQFGIKRNGGGGWLMEEGIRGERRSMFCGSPMWFAGDKPQIHDYVG